MPSTRHALALRDELGRPLRALARVPRLGAAGRRRPFAGVVWGASLVQLPAMGLAPPVWEYPPPQLASDVGFHLVYGVGVATAYAVLDR
jgi:hypothetical protein